MNILESSIQVQLHFLIDSFNWITIYEYWIIIISIKSSKLCLTKLWRASCRLQLPNTSRGLDNSDLYSDSGRYELRSPQWGILFSKFKVRRYTVLTQAFFVWLDRHYQIMILMSSINFCSTQAKQMRNNLKLILHLIATSAEINVL